MTEIRWHEETASHMQIKENKGVTRLTYPAFEQFKDICMDSVPDWVV